MVNMMNENSIITRADVPDGARFQYACKLEGYVFVAAKTEGGIPLDRYTHQLSGEVSDARVPLRWDAERVLVIFDPKCLWCITGVKHHQHPAHLEGVW
jgi:hypothetical protein